MAKRPSLNMKLSPELLERLKDGSEHCRMTMTEIVSAALAEKLDALEEEYGSFPERRRDPRGGRRPV